MNSPVSFETAKLLKEKGFDEPCSTSWETQYSKEPTITVSITQKYRTSTHPVGKLSAPTIAEVVMWIYDKHNIWISVDRYLDPEESEDFRYGYMIYYIDDYFGRGYKTPSDSYQAGIEYAIKNLI